MFTLSAHESRVLGVLIEKAQTTPQQYPLTLNALVNGCNQKNNREPVTNLSEEQVMQALDDLRNKGLAREVMLSGSRVEKFRHVAREVLEIDTNQLVILAELLLRGPQTMGELRGRASRMSPSGTLESLEIVKNVLDSLMQRPAESGGPMVRELPPAPGDRAHRYAQLLCPSLHPLDAPPTRAVAMSGDAAPHGDAALIDRIDRLESEVKQLRQAVHALAAAAGKQDLVASVD